MDKKDDLIETVMNDMKRTFGVETNHERQINMTIKELEREQKLNPALPYKEKVSHAMKAIVEHFVLNDATLDKEDWEDMTIEKLHMGIKKRKDDTKVQVIYCRLKDSSNVNRIR